MKKKRQKERVPIVHMSIPVIGNQRKKKAAVKIGGRNIMTNYEKYAGTLERFADFIAGLDAEERTGEALTRCFCRGQCGESQGDADCTEENLKRCIMVWLEKGIEEAGD